MHTGIVYWSCFPHKKARCIYVVPKVTHCPEAFWFHQLNLVWENYCFCMCRIEMVCIRPPPPPQLAKFILHSGWFYINLIPKQIGNEANFVSQSFKTGPPLKQFLNEIIAEGNHLLLFHMPIPCLEEPFKFIAHWHILGRLWCNILACLFKLIRFIDCSCMHGTIHVWCMHVYFNVQSHHV